jgi:hypothetical protein
LHAVGDPRGSGQRLQRQIKEFYLKDLPLLYRNRWQRHINEMESDNGSPGDRLTAQQHKEADQGNP